MLQLLYFGTVTACNGALYVTNLVIYRWPDIMASQWTSEGNVVTTGTNISGTITSGVVSSFSPFR
ncbi:MAG: hypothetical protein IPI78_19170 [Chitinophagaceae bacterium]|nr:hypothetical protein [Chitinophagaceae bacterium]